MDGSVINLAMVRAAAAEGRGAYAVQVSNQALLCREAANAKTALTRLLVLSTDPDEAVRASLYLNPTFSPFAAAHASVELGRADVTRVTWQAVAASPYVGADELGAVFALRNRGAEDRVAPPRSLVVLLPLVNNRACPRRASGSNGGRA